MPTPPPHHPAAIQRLRAMRVVTVVLPWVTLIAFWMYQLGAGARAPFAGALPERERVLLTALWLGSGAYSVLAWVLVGRVARHPRLTSVAATSCYALAMWVALLGAAAWGRGAAVSWFLLPYLWALVVVYALFPVRRLAPAD